MGKKGLGYTPKNDKIKQKKLSDLKFPVKNPSIMIVPINKTVTIHPVLPQPTLNVLFNRPVLDSPQTMKNVKLNTLNVNGSRECFNCKMLLRSDELTTWDGKYKIAGSLLIENKECFFCSNACLEIGKLIQTQINSEPFSESLVADLYFETKTCRQCGSIIQETNQISLLSFNEEFCSDNCRFNNTNNFNLEEEFNLLNQDSTFPLNTPCNEEVFPRIQW